MDRAVRGIWPQRAYQQEVPGRAHDDSRAYPRAGTGAYPADAARGLGISHWTSQKMADYIKKTEGVSVSQPWVSRLWRDNGIQPWRQGTFKISKDPEFEEKVRDVTDLYLNPPEGDAVVSAGVKSGIQALDRTQPLLPADFGKTGKRTHDYKRNGTTDMYAGLDIVTGKVTVELSPTHNSRDFLRLMKRIVAQYPGKKKIHAVLDNASVHTCEDTSKWLAEQDGRVVFHFTPTGASWMNQIEIWNGIITRQLIRRGTFRSVRALNSAIKRFTTAWNTDARPFRWTATADEILEKVRVIACRMAQLLGGTVWHVTPPAWTSRSGARSQRPTSRAGRVTSAGRTPACT